MTRTLYPQRLFLLSLFSLSCVAAENLIVEIEDDPNNEKYSRAWSLWKFCGCSKADTGDGTIGGLGAIADLWSMGGAFANMAYDVDYMPLDPFLVHVNASWLYSDNFYSSVELTFYLNSIDLKVIGTIRNNRPTYLFKDVTHELLKKIKKSDIILFQMKKI